MRKIKKAAGIVLAVIMTMSLCMSFNISSFAADDGSIKITNAVEDETYSIYKLFDVSYNNTTSSYYYTFDASSAWATFFLTGDGASYVTTSVVDANTYQATWTSEGNSTATFAKLALAYAQNNNIGPTAYAVADDSGELTFANLEYGYYLVDSSLGTVCSLTSTTPNAEITDKNGSPSADKQVQEDSSGVYGDSNTADIGEVVNFRTEISSAHNVSNLVLHDTMTEGLTLDTNSITVKVGSSLASADDTVDARYYTITTTSLTDGCTFEIAFEDEFTSTVLTSSQVIVVSYSATVNENAVIAAGGNTNETYVEYGNNGESTHDETITYVYDLYVYKYTTDATSGNDVALSGAKFVLYKTVNGVIYYAVLDNGNNVSSWTKYLDNAAIAADPDAPSGAVTATVVESGTDGLIHINGLDAGSYELKEIEAPAGYTLLTSTVDVEISSAGVVTGEGGSSATVQIGGVATQAIKVSNNSGTALPSTGGMGTKIFYTVGGLLVICAGILLITKRRMGK